MHNYHPSSHNSTELAQILVCSQMYTSICWLQYLVLNGSQQMAHNKMASIYFQLAPCLWLALYKFTIIHSVQLASVVARKCRLQNLGLKNDIKCLAWLVCSLLAANQQLIAILKNLSRQQCWINIDFRSISKVVNYPGAMHQTSQLLHCKHQSQVSSYPTAVIYLDLIKKLHVRFSIKRILQTFDN